MIMLVVGVGYTAYLLFSHKGADPLTVSELRSQAESIYDQQLRVEGKVAHGSIDWDSETEVMRLVLIDDKEILSVVHIGIISDDFKPGTDLEVQGRYRADRVLEVLSFGRPSSVCSFATSGMEGV
jgi:cytochrome c-type biogenesis protein CcmE